jgi:hypothetical protein
MYNRARLVGGYIGVPDPPVVFLVLPLDETGSIIIIFTENNTSLLTIRSPVCIRGLYVSDFF